jgi:hypothetical protein
MSIPFKVVTAVAENPAARQLEQDIVEATARLSLQAFELIKPKCGSNIFSRLSAVNRFEDALMLKPTIHTSKHFDEAIFTLTPKGITDVKIPKSLPQWQRRDIEYSAKFVNRLNVNEFFFLHASPRMTYRKLGEAFPKGPTEKMQRYALDGAMAFFRDQDGNRFTKAMEKVMY